MKRFKDFFESEIFILIVVMVLIAAIFVHTTNMVYGFYSVESDAVRFGIALMFSIPFSLLVMVFTIHKSNEKSWEFDASGWLATGTALMFILYLRPWTDILVDPQNNWQNALIKVIMGVMIGIGEYALPRLYLQIKNRKKHKKYVSPWDDSIQYDDPESFKSHIGGKLKGRLNGQESRGVPKMKNPPSPPKKNVKP